LAHRTSDARERRRTRQATGYGLAEVWRQFIAIYVERELGIKLIRRQEEGDVEDHLAVKGYRS
jgi:hypothetical protein